MSSINVNNDKGFKEEKDDGNENSKLNETNISNNDKLHKQKYKRIIQNIKLIVFLMISFIFIKFYSVSIKKIDIIYIKRTNINLNEIKKELNQKSKMRKLNEKVENITSKDNIINIEDDNNKKIGVAFVHNDLNSDSISKFITLTSSYLIKTGKYNICFITRENDGELKNISKTENIDYFILFNELSTGTINLYKSLGKKVIGVFHKIFLPKMPYGSYEYRSLKHFELYDSLIFISSYNNYYENLNFKKAVFIRNLCSFEPSKIINSFS